MGRPPGCRTFPENHWRSCLAQTAAGSPALPRVFQRSRLATGAAQCCSRTRPPDEFVGGEPSTDRARLEPHPCDDAHPCAFELEQTRWQHTRTQSRMPSGSSPIAAVGAIRNGTTECQRAVGQHQPNPQRREQRLLQTRAHARELRSETSEDA